MDPQTAATLCRYAERLAHAKHGAKGPILAEACAELDCTRATFYRMLEEVQPSGRKRRADAGDTALTAKEADAISGYLMEGYNNINKKGRTLRTAVKVLRDNGEILAGRVDPDTGEIFRLSLDAISRALMHYQVHPDQLRRPTPHTSMASLHPNHVHQVDSSVGTIYYLADGQAIIELDKATHYKNKPWNLEAISEKRVIRYALADHTSGVVRFRYYPHSENARHTVHFLAWCWAPKDSPHDPFHGVPKLLYVDPGIANALVRRFCDRLGVRLEAHKPKNARATGGVEGAHNYAVEMPFEHGLRDIRSKIRDFEDLNRVAERWQLHWNAKDAHGRHGMTRFEAWMHIKQEQLRTTAPMDTLLTLATEQPKKCQVQGNLTAQFKSRIWDVSNVPGVMVKGDVYLHWHPFIPDTAMAVVEDADGIERHIELAERTGAVDPAAGQWGFLKGAPILGEEYKAPADTQIDKNRKRVRLVASEQDTQQADEAARKKKDFTAFGGRINPYKEAEEAELPTYIKKRGTEINAAPPTVEPIPLTHIQAAKLLKAKLGDTWTGEYLAKITSRYPGGVPEADIELLLEEFQGKSPAKAPVLKVVK